MAQDYWIADEVNDIVQSYMKYHADLIGAKICCVFKEKASKSDGVPIVGKIGKVTAKYKPFMEEPFDYMMEIGADAWADLDMSQREAWVDHLLEHAYGIENERTGDMSWKLRSPELMVFPTTVNRHGLGWKTGLAKIATLQLPQNTPTPPTSKSGKGTNKTAKKSSGSNAAAKGSNSDDFDDLMSDL